MGFIKRWGSCREVTMHDSLSPAPGMCCYKHLYLFVPLLIAVSSLQSMFSRLSFHTEVRVTSARHEFDHVTSQSLSISSYHSLNLSLRSLASPLIGFSSFISHPPGRGENKSMCSIHTKPLLVLWYLTFARDAIPIWNNLPLALVLLEVSLSCLCQE